MNYTHLIDPELKSIAKRVPYNKFLIKTANIYQMLAFALTGISREISCKRIIIRENGRLPLKVAIYEPASAADKLPCLLYIHGGAFSYKASAHHKKLACIYALEANCRVVLPDYHLLPEHPYPTAYQDVLSVYKWLLKNAESLLIDRELIGIAGDSSGGAIAAAICNAYEKEALPIPCAQMLIYPVTDASMSTKSIKLYSDTPLWNSENNKKMWEFYLKNVTGENIRNASPMQNVLPHKLPDTYIETAEYDCLHDEGILYAERLMKAGAKVELNDTKGTIHGYDSAIKTQIAQNNIEKRILFLKKCFSHGN